MKRRLTKAEKEICQQLGLDEEAFLASANGEDAGQVAAHSRSGTAGLTEGDREVCRQLGLDPEVFLEHK